MQVKFAKQAQQFGSLIRSFFLSFFLSFVRHLFDHVFPARVRKVIGQYLLSRQRKGSCLCYGGCEVPCTCRLICVQAQFIHSLKTAFSEAVQCSSINSTDLLLQTTSTYTIISILSNSFIYQLMHNRVALKEY